MKKHSLYKPLALLLLSLTFFTACNGQENKKHNQLVVNKTKTIPAGQPKIKKPTDRHQDDNIHCILQDKAGNIWVCTSGEGVYRYDGKLFTNFTEKDGLSSNFVWCMLEDKSGILWFGTDSGLCRYDPSAMPGTGSETFTRIPISVSNGNDFYSINVANNNPVTCAVWSMLQDKTGNLWIGTRDSGIYKYDPLAVPGGSKSFTHFLHNDGIINKENLQPRWVANIFEDKKGNIWFASGPLSPEGAYRYDPVSGGITAFDPKGDKWVRSIIEDKKGNLLFVTRHQGVCRYDPSAALGSPETFTNITKKGGLNDWSITTIFEDKAGNLWFGEERGNNSGEYEGGLWCFDGKTYTKFTTKDGLSNNGVWSIMEDRAGNIWAASRCNGLSRYDPSAVLRTGSKAFTNFTE